MRWRGLRIAVPAVAATASLVAGAAVVGASAGPPSAAPVALPAAAPAADPLRQKKNRVDGEIDQVQQSLEGASKDVVAAAVAVRVAQRNLSAAQAASRAAQAALATAVAHDKQVAADLAVAEAQQAKAERQLAAGRAQQEDTRGQLGRMAREAYMGSGISGLAVALGADSPDEFADRVALAGIALRSQGGVVDELAVQQAELVARGTKVQAVAGQVAELKRRSAAAVAARRAAEKAAAAAAARTAALLSAEQAALKVAQSKVAAEKKRLASLQDDQAKLQAMLVARAKAQAEAEARRRRAGGRAAAVAVAAARAGGAPSSGGGYLSHAANGPITSPFGMRYHPILHIWRLHTGIDFGVAVRHAGLRRGAGTVISAGWAGGYGNRIVIDHGMVRGVDLATTYNHLTRFVVAAGHVVARPADRLLRHDRPLHRLPPALRDARQRHLRQPDELALSRTGRGPLGPRRPVVPRTTSEEVDAWPRRRGRRSSRATARRATTTSSRTSSRPASCSIGTEVKALRMGRASLVDGVRAVSTRRRAVARGRAHPRVHQRHVDQPRRRAGAASCCCTATRSRRSPRETRESGRTIVPLSLYFKDGRAKVEIAVARGKKNYDKRQALRERQDSREAERAMSLRANR